MADHHQHGNVPHVHGSMDVTTHQKTFDAFMRFWVYLAAVAIGILIFLALTNA